MASVVYVEIVAILESGRTNCAQIRIFLRMRPYVSCEVLHVSENLIASLLRALVLLGQVMVVNVQSELPPAINENFSADVTNQSLSVVTLLDVLLVESRSFECRRALLALLGAEVESVVSEVIPTLIR